MKYKRFTMVISMFLLLAAAACSGTVKSNYYEQGPADGTSRGTIRGMGFSPRSTQPYDIINFYKKAREAGTAVFRADDWKELEYARGFPTLMAEQAHSQGLVYIAGVQAFNPADGKLYRALDDKTLKKYLDSAVDFASRYRPSYLALGTDVNVLYTKSPGDFTKFTGLFDRVYDAVKAASPNTRVFTIFQLDRMKGMNGGLYGGVNDTSNTQWQLLDQFPKSDLVAFSTYPCMNYRDPGDIPADYFSDISSHTTKPLAFTGTGWHTAAGQHAWIGSEALQDKYARSFISAAGSLKAEFIIWNSLYDQPGQEPFNSMGLLDKDDLPRPAWQTWAGKTAE